MYIYVITNKVNGKKYIGQTILTKLETYFYRNIWRAKSGETGKPFLYNAIRKYGENAFEIEALVVVHSKEDADYYERFLISEFQTQDRSIGYNLAAGGGGKLGLPAWNSGKKNPYSFETLERMSESQKLRMKRDGHPAKGKKYTPEHCQRMSKVFKDLGIKPSVDACRLGGQMRHLKEEHR